MTMITSPEKKSSIQMHCASSSPPEVTLLIENFKKSNNWGPLLRCCAAFGISQIFVVGFDQCSVQGSHGSHKHVELLAFHNHQSAVEALRKNGFQLVGLLHGASGAYSSHGSAVVKEIVEEKDEVIASISPTTETSSMGSMPNSFPVGSRPFFNRTCLVVGKKSKGLLWSLAELCEKFIHIPHDGPGDGAWLTVEAGLSIVLHEFALWAGYNKRSSAYQGQKYQVERKIKGSEINDKQSERKRRRDEQQEESQEMGGGGMTDIFSKHQADDGDY